MSDARMEQTLTALLQLAAEPAAASGEAPPTADRQTAPLPTLAQRIDMFVRAVHGADCTVTAEMRAAARERVLAAMAADLAEQTMNREPPALPADSATLATPLIAGQSAAAPTAPGEGLSRFSAALARGVAQVLSAAGEAFAMRNIRLAAVPLIALFVIGTVWTSNMINDENPVTDRSVVNPPNSETFAGNTPRKRSLEPTPVDSVREQDLKRAIAAAQAALGPTHPSVARRLVDLAALYRADGRYREAEELCTRALEIQQQTLGPKDPDLVRTLTELAMVYRAEGRPQEADDLWTRAGRP